MRIQGQKGTGYRIRNTASLDNSFPNITLVLCLLADNAAASGGRGEQQLRGDAPLPDEPAAVLCEPGGVAPLHPPGGGGGGGGESGPGLQDAQPLLNAQL